MTKLSCIGAEKVKLDYIKITPESINISYYTDDGQRTGSQAFVTRNGGTFTYEWVENISRRSYMKIGTYVSGSYNPPRGDCGGTRYFLCNGVNEDAKDKDLELSRGEVPLLGVYSSGDGINEAFKNAWSTTQQVYESWIENGVGYEGSSDWAKLLKVSECLSDNSIQYYFTRALSAQVTHTFRKFASVWNLKIWEDGDLFFTSPYRSGIGENNWESAGGRDVVVYRPKTSGLATRNYTKALKNTGVKIKQEFNESSRIRKIYIEEYYPSNPTVPVSSYQIETLYGGLPMPEISLTCIGICPPNTCEVDCGNHICCYGSDGIAVSSFLK